MGVNGDFRLEEKKNGLGLGGDDDHTGLQFPLFTSPKHLCPYIAPTGYCTLIFNPSVLKLACRTTVLSCVQGRDLIYQLSLNSTQPWGFETAPGGKLPNLNLQGLLLSS